ncbi:hypothetical protein CFO_g3426 [Ceratocystis platani]|uniref:Myb-like domain-containing protein n=1 Tax=Ceratocystis fimbriata f. sp. platani TaxID=88771 RepID=A0A0F8B017_CERFI|nr:hypothetical protein CFO_g3426 [Ceratocystis platani]
MAPMSMQPHSSYTPTGDVADRHEYGVVKSRKMASTGGGRAWSEEEEVYLLQTRLQKMPYKHIAAHLKKTELACRLHYHQLSHGSSRRKRANSESSGSSGQSPTLASAATASPMYAAESAHIPRSITPPGSCGGHYTPASPHSLQLPSIHANTPPSFARSHSRPSLESPRLPSILPKPYGMTLPLPGYPTPLPEPHSAPIMASFPRIPSPNPLLIRSTTPAPVSTGPMHSSAMPSPLPPVSHSNGAIDMNRLSAAYATHKAQFWAAVSAEYGNGVSPAALEGAWERKTPSPSSCYAPSAPRFSHQGPISPAASPDQHTQREAEYRAHGQSQDRTRISAILGAEANPRPSHEHEFVRRADEERTGPLMAA